MVYLYNGYFLVISKYKILNVIWLILKIYWMKKIDRIDMKLKMSKINLWWKLLVEWLMVVMGRLRRKGFEGCFWGDINVYKGVSYMGIF